MPTGNMSNVASATYANNGFGSVKNILGPLTSTASQLTADRVVVTDSSTKLLKANTNGITAANLAVLSGQSTALSTQFAGKVNTTGTNATISATNTFTGTNTFSSTVTLSGGLIMPITNVNTATYNVLATDRVLHVIYTKTGAVTNIQLMSAQVVNGRIITIKDGGLSESGATTGAGTNNITITTEGSETIDGADTLVINTDYAAVTLYCDGTNWFII